MQSGHVDGFALGGMLEVVNPFCSPAIVICQVIFLYALSLNQQSCYTIRALSDINTYSIMFRVDEAGFFLKHRG